MPGYSPPILSFFSDAQFGTTPRSTLEYVLNVAAFVQMDFVNGDVADIGHGFEQVLLRDPALTGGGMYSLWFSDPGSVRRRRRDRFGSYRLFVFHARDRS